VQKDVQKSALVGKISATLRNPNYFPEQNIFSRQA
jgi:hypothetical protein